MSDFKKKIGSAYLFLGGKKFLAILLLCLIASLGIKGTIGFYADKEQSLNNQFIAGMIDLKVGDSFAKLNGADKAGWDLTDLTFEKFLDFVNLKAGDNGSDKIDLSVQSNPSWLCGQIKLTANDENTTQEPEFKEGDDLDNSADLFDGELAQNLSFVAFADNNNDNLPQTSEIILQGKASDISASGTAVALADANKNVWDITGPVFAGNTKSIKKIWCLGTFNADFTCNGLDVSNKVQSDLVKADIAFYAVQQRNNLNFLCQPFDIPSTSTTSTGQQFVICSNVTWQCKATQKFSSREACRASTQTECYESLNACTPNCFNDHPQPRRFFSCNMTQGICGQTALYETQQQCEQATGGVCYLSVDTCTATCNTPKYQYYTCDTANKVCGQTAAYTSLSDCQSATGKTCYQTTDACNAVCQPPKYYFYNCLNPATNSCGATAQQYTSRAACQTANPGAACYQSNSECLAACQVPKLRFYSCNTSTYACDQTALFTTPAECQTATGKVCYESQGSCSPFCQKPLTPFYYCNMQNPAAPTCALAGNFADLASCVTQTHLPCAPSLQACNSMCKPAQYTYYTCDSASYSCSATSQTYASASACAAATGKQCYASQADCGQVCQRPTYYYYYCDSALNYTCKQTYTKYFNKELCKAGTGGRDCFDNTTDCSTACQPPSKKWQACDTTCFTCGETVGEYRTQSECQTATGKKCYETSADCAYFCKPAFDTPYAPGPVMYRWAAQARVGDNYNCWHPETKNFNETRILLGGNEVAGKHNSWTPYSTYDFTLTHDGSGKVTFDIRNGHATVFYVPIALMGDSITLSAVAPDYGGGYIKIFDFNMVSCGKTYPVNYEVMAANGASHSLRITGSGVKLTQPYVIRGELRLWWAEWTNLGPNNPSVTISFN